MTDVEALYTANQDRLFRYFCRAVGHIDDARELTQDVFVRVSRSVIPTGPEGALRGWLFRLATALGDPAGRVLLIDLVALRHVVQPDLPSSTSLPQRRPAWRPLLAAAAMVVALIGGYVIGERRSAIDVTAAPAPSRVVQANDWQSLPPGGVR